MFYKSTELTKNVDVTIFYLEQLYFLLDIVSIYSGLISCIQAVGQATILGGRISTFTTLHYKTLSPVQYTTRTITITWNYIETSRTTKYKLNNLGINYCQYYVRVITGLSDYDVSTECVPLKSFQSSKKVER